MAMPMVTVTSMVISMMMANTIALMVLAMMKAMVIVMTGNSESDGDYDDDGNRNGAVGDANVVDDGDWRLR